MKLKIRTAKHKLFHHATIYYVSSKSGGAEHIVVNQYSTSRFFCDCKDFMTRRLPLLGSSSFTNCKHGVAVSNMLNNQVVKKSNGIRYGVFVDNGYASGRRSVDIPEEFGSMTEAGKAVQYYESHNGIFGRVVRAL